MKKDSKVEGAALNTSKAAAYIGLNKCDLDKARIDGSLSGLKPPPFIRIGRRVRYIVEDLDVWLESQKRFITLAEEYSSASSD